MSYRKSLLPVVDVIKDLNNWVKRDGSVELPNFGRYVTEKVNFPINCYRNRSDVENKVATHVDFNLYISIFNDRYFTPNHWDAYMLATKPLIFLLFGITDLLTLIRVF